MSRLLPTAVVLVLIVAGVSLPLTVMVSPILAQRVDTSAGSTPPSTATPPGPPAARPHAIVLTFEGAEIETVTQAVSEIVRFSIFWRPTSAAR